MMMRLALAVLCLCVLHTSATGNVFKVGTQKCTSAPFKVAQDNFAKKLNLPTTDNWQAPLLLYKGMQDIYGNDPDLGLVKVCNAFNALIDELNGKDIDAKTCFDPLFLLTNDNNANNAIHFAGVVGLLRFQCGPGFYPAVQNDNWKRCASGTFKKSGDKLYAILQNTVFNTDIDRINRCKIVKDNELEFYRPFYDACGRRGGRETAYFACQSFNQFFNTMYPECTNECSLIN